MGTLKFIGDVATYFAGLRKFRVRDYQRGLLWRNGKFQGLLEKDEKWIFDPMGEYTMEVFSRLDPWFRHEQLPAMVKSGLLPEEEVALLDLDSNQRALVWRDGVFCGILEPGRWAWWKGLVDIRYEVYDIRDEHGRFVHADLDSIMMNPAFAAHFLVVLVRPGSKASYYHNGEFVGLLEPGKYVYWKAVDGNQSSVVDMREITLDIGGQDMLTADKLALRLNVSLTCRVVDVMKSLDESVDAKQALYREAQLLLRAKVGGVELDSLLSDKDSLAGDLERELRAKAVQYGYSVTSFGVRDIILPGDIKAIMNKVVEAKKASEAATITRREEYPMVYIDGSLGEGGGQVLRTSLSLSMITGTALHIDKIRARRRKPGLMRQHMTAVKAAEEICGARVDGDFPGSTEIEFKPGRIRHGNYSFAIGTAGSATLVLQTVLPVLLSADGESNLTLEGGTHNPLAPPYDFLERTFLPLLRRMGAAVDVALARHGFFPAGGGKVKVRVQGGKLSPLSLLKRGGEVKLSGCCVYSGLPESVAKREAEALRRRLGLSDSQCRVLQVESAGPGNVVMVDARDEKGDHSEVFTAFGEKALRAEKVADAAGSAARLYAASTAVLGKHSADQILLPLALAGGGEFSTLPLTEHSKTNMQVIESFLPVKFDHQTDDYSVYTVTCRDKG